MLVHEMGCSIANQHHRNPKSWGSGPTDSSGDRQWGARAVGEGYGHPRMERVHMPGKTLWQRCPAGGSRRNGGSGNRTDGETGSKTPNPFRPHLNKSSSTNFNRKSSKPTPASSKEPSLSSHPPPPPRQLGGAGGRRCGASSASLSPRACSLPGAEYGCSVYF